MSGQLNLLVKIVKQLGRKVIEMSTLNINWQPEFGTMYYWLAVDSKGKIARMMNNNWGNIPLVLLQQDNIEETLDLISEYIWEESSLYLQYPKNKMGKTILDLYSSYPTLYSKIYMENFIEQNSNYNLELQDENLPSRKGIFIYQAIEGNKEGEDYPVGYEGKTKMGDYYRYLMPTIYATINDFPKELWHGIALSNTLDFTQDRLIFNNDINQYFTDYVRG